MEEWDPIANYLIARPENLLPNSRTKVWWKCKSCGISYYMSPERRIYYLKRHMSPCMFEKGLRRKIRHSDFIFL